MFACTLLFLYFSYYYGSIYFPVLLLCFRTGLSVLLPSILKANFTQESEEVLFHTLLCISLLCRTGFSIKCEHGGNVDTMLISNVCQIICEFFPNHLHSRRLVLNSCEVLRKILSNPKRVLDLEQKYRFYTFKLNNFQVFSVSLFYVLFYSIHSTAKNLFDRCFRQSYVCIYGMQVRARFLSHSPSN